MCPSPRGSADAVIRVAVADDQALVRLGLRVLLETEEGMELVGEAVDGRSALELVRRLRPDVVITRGNCPRPMPVLNCPAGPSGPRPWPSRS